MILEAFHRQKRVFDVTNKKDIESAKMFFSTLCWRHEFSCPFYLEEPYLTVPDMMRDKLVRKFLKIEQNA